MKNFIYAISTLSFLLIINNGHASEKSTESPLKAEHSIVEITDVHSFKEALSNELGAKIQPNSVIDLLYKDMPASQCLLTFNRFTELFNRLGSKAKYENLVIFLGQVKFYNWIDDYFCYFKKELEFKIKQNKFILLGCYSDAVQDILIWFSYAKGLYDILQKERNPLIQSRCYRYIADSFIETQHFDAFRENLEKAFKLADAIGKREIIEHFKKYPQYKEEEKDVDFVNAIDSLKIKPATITSVESIDETDQQLISSELDSYVENKKSTFICIARNRNIIDLVLNFGVRQINESNLTFTMQDYGNVYLPVKKTKKAEASIRKETWIEYLEGKYNKNMSDKIREAYVIFKLDNLTMDEFERFTDLLKALTKGTESPVFILANILKWTNIISEDVADFEKLIEACTLMKTRCLVYERRLFIAHVTYQICKHPEFSADQQRDFICQATTIYDHICSTNFLSPLSDRFEAFILALEKLLERRT